MKGGREINLRFNVTIAKSMVIMPLSASQILTEVIGMMMPILPRRKKRSRSCSWPPPKKLNQVPTLGILIQDVPLICQATRTGLSSWMNQSRAK